MEGEHSHCAAGPAHWSGMRSTAIMLHMPERWQLEFAGHATSVLHNNVQARYGGNSLLSESASNCASNCACGEGKM